MQALNIQWRARRRPFSTLGLMLALAALLALAWVASDAADADDTWQALQARQARLTRSTQPGKRSTSTSADTIAAKPGATGREDTQSAAQIDAQLQLPWDALLHALETPSTKNVALMGVDAQAGARSLHLVGEARNMADALAYVKQLRESPVLQKIYLTGQEEKMSGTQKVLRFSLDASWSAAP